MLVYFDINQNVSGSLIAPLITCTQRVFGLQSSIFNTDLNNAGLKLLWKKWRGKLLKNRKGLLKIACALGLKFHWEHMDHWEHLSSTAPGKYLNQLLLGKLLHVKKRQTLMIKRGVHTIARQFLLPVLKKHKKENIGDPERQMTSRRETHPIGSVQHHVFTDFKQRKKLCLLLLVPPLQLKLPHCSLSISMRKLNHFQECSIPRFTSHQNISVLVLLDTGCLALGMVLSHWGAGRLHQKMGT